MKTPSKNKIKSLTYRAIIQKDGEGFHGLVPALPGCHTYRYSLDEVRDNLKSAMDARNEMTTV